MNDDIKTLNFIYTKDYVSYLLNSSFEETYLSYLDLLKKHFPEVLNNIADYGNSYNVHQSSFKKILLLIQNKTDIHLLSNQIASEYFTTPFINNTPNLKFQYHLIRQLLIKLLPSYTNVFHLYTSIINELEENFILLEKLNDEAWLNREELLQHNKFLYSVINNSIDGIAAFDKELRVLEWNQVLENHHNIKKEDIIGRKIYEALPEYKDSAEMKSSVRVLKGERVFLTNLSYKTKEYGWYDAYMAPIFNGNVVEAILCIFRDITKRKEDENLYKEQKRKLEIANEELKEQREEIETSNKELQESLLKLIATQDALKENEVRLNEAQAVAHLGSWEYDIEQNNIFWSDELKRIFGYAPNDKGFDYQTYLSLIHPDDQELINSCVNNTYKTFEPYSFEHRIIKKGGEIRWIQAVGKAVVSENKVVKLKGTALDITERKIAEENLKEEQHFIQKITDTTPNVISVLDLVANKNIYYNKELIRLTGYPKEELEQIISNKNYFSLLIHPKDQLLVRNYIEKFLKYAGNESKEIDYRIIDKTGKIKWVTSRHTVFKRSEDGSAVQIIHNKRYHRKKRV